MYLITIPRRLIEEQPKPTVHILTAADYPYLSACVNTPTESSMFDDGADTVEGRLGGRELT